MNTSARSTILLDCNHTLDFSKGQIPPLFSELFCFRCNKGRIAKSILPHWHSRCKDSGCRYGQYFGQDETTCRRKAIEHANAKGHVVHILYGNDKKDVVGAGMTPDDRLGLRAAAAQQSAILRQIRDARVTEIVTVSLPENP